MPKRLLATWIALALGVFSCSVVHAQLDKILGHAVSWILQKQIDELDRANDPSRGLSEYESRNGYDSRELYAPREPSSYQDTSVYRADNRGDDRGRQVDSQGFAPPTQ